MKICKNNKDVILHPVTNCNLCEFKIGLHPCFWFKIFGIPSLGCGCIRVNSLSDIFKL